MTARSAAEVGQYEPGREQVRERALSRPPALEVDPDRVPAPGHAVEEGQGILVVEAMKMENEIASEKAGKVTRIAVEPGQNVESDGLLAVVD